MNDGLGAALIRLVADILGPFLELLGIVCLLLAAWLFLQGCLRLFKTSEDKFHGPGGAGTALSFVGSAVLATLPAWFNAATETVFGTGSPGGAATLGYGGERGADYNAMLRAAFALVALVGLLAFVKGVLMFRAAADGRPGATAGRAFAHVIGGVAAWHITGVIQAVQSSLGIKVLKIQPLGGVPI